MTDKLHPLVTAAGREMADGKLDRREFLRVATLLGVGAGAAYSMAGLSEPAMAQGAGRHQRGLACFWSAKTLAEARGWTFGWRLVEAHGVGHDHEKMFDHPNCELALYGTGGVPLPEAKSGLPADQQKQEQRSAGK